MILLVLLTLKGPVISAADDNFFIYLQILLGTLRVKKSLAIHHVILILFLLSCKGHNSDDLS